VELLSQDYPGVQEEVVLNVRDVTERVRVEERLKESEQRFRAQYKGIPVPTYSWRKVDEDFVLVDHNDAAYHFSHGRIADLLGSRATEVFSNEPQILELLSRCFEEKTIIRQEMPWQLLSSTVWSRPYGVQEGLRGAAMWWCSTWTSTTSKP
jgi:PAS domain-containing protein